MDQDKTCSKQSPQDTKIGSGNACGRRSEDGELRVRVEPSHEVEDVGVKADRLVLLRSRDVLHQVNAVYSERFSLTTWFASKQSKR